MSNPTPQVTPENTRLGWIGTGVMGVSMCGRLMDTGFQVIVTTRTREKAQALLDRGAQWADSPKAVAEASDVVFSIVGFPEDVREVYLGKDGLLAGASKGCILLDMTTSRRDHRRQVLSLRHIGTYCIHRAVTRSQSEAVRAIARGLSECVDVALRRTADSILRYRIVFGRVLP